MADKCVRKLFLNRLVVKLVRVFAPVNDFESIQMFAGRHDTQHDDTQHNDTQHIDIQHNDTQHINT